MVHDRTAPILGKRRQAITAGLLLGMSLGALEATVVGTAMPTIVATLGGLAHYSWVFSAYLLTSTASVPIWGRLSDLYGRRRMYLIVGGRLPRRVGGVRRRHHDAAADCRAGDTGAGRRRHHPADDDDHRRALLAGGAAAHAGAVQRRLGHGLGARAARRRLHHRRALVALGLLHQHPVRPALRGRDCVRVPRVTRHVSGEGGLARRRTALFVRERTSHRARRRQRRRAVGRDRAGALRGVRDRRAAPGRADSAGGPAGASRSFRAPLAWCSWSAWRSSAPSRSCRSTCRACWAARPPRPARC